MKKAIISLLLGATLLGVGGNAILVHASENNNTISGGWSESSGYYQSNYSRASSSPDKHTGKRLSRLWNSGGEFEYASYGETIWKNTYHYTNARVENRKGTALTEAGRQYGTGYTDATSPYYRPDLFENIECKSYWGL